MIEYIVQTQLAERVPLSRSTIGRMEKAGRFPRRIKIGATRVAWRRDQVEAWLADPENWRPPDGSDKGASQ